MKSKAVSGWCQVSMALAAHILAVEKIKEKSVHTAVDGIHYVWPILDKSALHFNGSFLPASIMCLCVR